MNTLAKQLKSALHAIEAFIAYGHVPLRPLPRHLMMHAAAGRELYREERAETPHTTGIPEETCRAHP